MSQDSFGEDDSIFFDEAALAQIESIESSAVAGPSRPPPKPVQSDTIVIPSSDDFFDALPSDQLAVLDAVTLPRKAAPPRTHLQPRNSASSSSQSMYQTHLTFRKENQSTKGKRWDRTAFSATGRRKVQTSKGKGKGRWNENEEEEEEEEDQEEDQGEPLLPDPIYVLHKPYEPRRHTPNHATIGTYIYPSNRSKRDYQFEIVRAALTDNCLVALPTGLGKTFIAGVVMLNYYRWFPSAKIVFLAPTKPLVQQQIQACHATCGIPQADAAVMTGEIKTASERAVLWQEKRVFYCTPQTLMNDLAQRAVDPRDIVLAVFDEAHKASGNYAYTTIQAYLMAHHPYFRVLALTATPGADVPKVQAVVDALHISRIEIREAEAPEIRKYMNEKVITKHYVQIDGVFAEFRDRWVKLMKPYVGPLVTQDILSNRDLDCVRLRAFRLLSIKQDLGRRSHRSGGTEKLGRFFPALTTLHTMATGMAYLLEFSTSMFCNVLQDLGGGKVNKTTGKKPAKGGTRALKENKEFRRLSDEAEDYVANCNSGTFGLSKSDKHPKMIKTLELLLAYFGQAAEDAKTHGLPNDTRAMVFCSFRPCVLDIVDMLNEHSGLLKATKFVGQQKGKSEGDKGFTQKDQKQTVKDFVAGKYNILVSTSIGEEGLDIGEVDMVICYDMPKTSIKLLQRIGRTGRKRQGQVHVLMAEGREDSHWDSAQQTHREIQHEIMHSRNLELFEDVERLLPGGELPACIEQQMEVEDWKLEEPTTKRKRATPKEPKRPRGEPLPEGAQVGFKSVLDILQKKSGKKSAKTQVKDVVDTYSDSDGDLPDLDGTKRVNHASDSSEEEAAIIAPPKKARKEPVKKTVTKPVKKAAPRKKVLPPSSPVTSPARPSAIDFLMPEPVRRQSILASPRRSLSPDAVIPSSTSPSPPPAVQAVQRSRTLARLPSSLAAKAGFSQLDMSYVLGSSDDELLLQPGAVSGSSATRSTKTAMLPPPIPSSPAITQVTPFPVRRIGLGARRPRVLSSSSDHGGSPQAKPQQPTTPGEASPEILRGVRRLKKQVLKRSHLMELDAEVSGSDSADEPSSDYENSSDGLFANEFMPTQAPKGYDQQAAYVAGLATQGPGRRTKGPAFEPRERTQKFLAKARKPVLLTDDERSDGQISENEYELGSFVCDDEELDLVSSSQASAS